MKKNCDNCIYQINYGDSVEYTYCGFKSKKKEVKRKYFCDNYINENINCINNQLQFVFNGGYKII